VHAALATSAGPSPGITERRCPGWKAQRQPTQVALDEPHLRNQTQAFGVGLQDAQPQRIAIDGDDERAAGQRQGIAAQAGAEIEDERDVGEALRPMAGNGLSRRLFQTFPGKNRREASGNLRAARWRS
jgi:hypothetical protein